MKAAWSVPSTVLIEYLKPLLTVPLAAAASMVVTSPTFSRVPEASLMVCTSSAIAVGALLAIAFVSAVESLLAKATEAVFTATPTALPALFVTVSLAAA